MAWFDTTWYVSSVAYAAVTTRPQNTAVAAGIVRRQFTTPAVNSERCYVCVTAGTTANTTDASWGTNRGGSTTDGTATWMECTGAAAVNGDATNTLSWSGLKALGTPNIGYIIKRNNGVSYQICIIAGSLGASEPAFSNVAGTQVAESGGAAQWKSLGPVGNFPAWGAPHARLFNAYASSWGVAGNKFYLADNHAETQATNMNLNSPGTVALPTYAVCVDRTAALPPVAANFNTGASITATGGSTITINLIAAGTAHYQGLTFTSGDAANVSVISLNGSTGASNYYYKNCAFILGGTGANGNIAVGINGTAPGYTLLDNCTMQFAATVQNLRVFNGYFEWRNTPNAIQGSTFPTTLFNTSVFGGIPGCQCVCRGVDFSAFPNQLVVNTQLAAAPLIFEDCKFHASMTRYGTASGYGAAPVVTSRCDSGVTNYKSTRDEYAGSQISETSITRVGGATDGTTPQSTKIVTNAQATFLTPYRMLRLAQWNDVTGADRTVTVCGTINSASLPTDGELWMDVQYLGSSSSPVASFKTTAKAHPLSTAAAIASDGSTWNGGGSGAGWSPFKLVATLTSPQPQQKGYVYVSVRAAKPSTTYYIDPQITIN
jgi:hypothetical protein